ncbi:MAG TPA: outer membrane protein transport protein [Polyangia bacterium]|jgi:long-chain fatty acid transport protein|nr:outer membrane protein transport protein [Polyangia bacterium]
MNIKRTIVLVGTMVPLLALRQPPVRAAGFAAAHFGGELGNVTTDNPTALYYNPAGIGFSEGTQLFADGILALRGVTYQHSPAATDPAEPVGAQGATFGKANLFNVFGGPMFGATTRLSNWALGAGLMVPFGGRAQWATNDKFKNDPNFPLAADGIQRWDSIDGAITSIYFTAGVAYRWRRLSVGATANLIRSSVSSTQAKTPIGTGDPDITREGRASLDVSGYEGSFGIGVLFEAIENRLWLGAGYQAQPGFGAVTLKGGLRTTYQGSEAVFPVQFHEALPDSARVGMRFRGNQYFELRLSGEWTRWSVLQSQCVSIEGTPCLVDASGADATPMSSVVQNLRRRWKNTYGIRAGSSVWVRSSVELFAGLGFETAAVPDSTLDPALPDANSVSGSLGARVRVTDTFFLAGSYTHIQDFDRDNTGKSELADAVTPTKLPDAGGKYTQWIGLFNLNLQKQF